MRDSWSKLLEDLGRDGMSSLERVELRVHNARNWAWRGPEALIMYGQMPITSLFFGSASMPLPVRENFWRPSGPAAVSGQRWCASGSFGGRWKARIERLPCLNGREREWGITACYNQCENGEKQKQGAGVYVYVCGYECVCGWEDALRQLREASSPGRPQMMPSGVWPMMQKPRLGAG